MLLEINFQPNYKEMWLRKQKLVNYNNKHENEKWVQYDYEVGHYASILRDGNYRKLEGEKLVPFRIIQVHTNGSVKIKTGIVNGQIKIECLAPHFGDPPTQALVLFDWVLRLIGLGWSLCLLSCIRFWFLLDSPASIREASANNIRIYRMVKWTFGYFLENTFDVSQDYYFFLKAPHFSKTPDSWLKIYS